MPRQAWFPSRRDMAPTTNMLIVGHGFTTQKAKPAKVVVLKHPPYAFMMFASENRASVVEEYTEKTQEIMTTLSIKWKAMSNYPKSPYKNAYAEKAKTYNTSLAKLQKKTVRCLFVKKKYPMVEAETP